MRHQLLLTILLPLICGQGAEPGSEFAAGRAQYEVGAFKKAATHFQRALKTDPDDPEVNYWAGMAYQGLADVAAPFGGRYNSKARLYLTKAVDLAPRRADYRRELFAFLLDSAAASPASLRLAVAMLRQTSEVDPEYNSMRRRLERETVMAGSMEARFDRLFLAIPGAAFRIAPR
jgi:tetratricopeptide (TPR) repeat protein